MILLAHFDLFFFFFVHYKEIKSTTTKIASFSFPIFSQQPIEVYKSVTNQFKHAKKEKKTVKKQYKNGSNSDRLRATKLTCEVKKPKDFVSPKNRKFKV